MAVAGTLGAEARRAAMLKQLEEDGALGLAESATAWQVHPMTVRRDFDSLVAAGLGRRVRGGIVVHGGDDFSHRQYQHAEAKRRIGGKLRSLVKPNTLIAMDASTTVHQLAEQLTGIRGLSVITNGFSAFQSLHGREGIRTYLTGGEREEQNISLVGALTVLAVQQFNLDTCFLSTMSLDPDFGTSEMTLEQVAVKQAMKDNAQTAVLAVDSAKLGTRARFRSIPLQGYDILVTELAPTDARLDEYRRQVPLIL